jgi:hypothetical protein
MSLCLVMCLEVPLSMSQVSSPGVIDPERAEKKNIIFNLFFSQLLGWLIIFSYMGMMSFVISLLVFFLSCRTVLSNVSHLITMITLIRG